MENPYLFDPLNPEILRVLSPGGRIEITASPANGTVNQALGRLNQLGLRQVGEAVPVPNPGFTNTDGIPIFGTFLRHTIERVN